MKNFRDLNVREYPVLLARDLRFLTEAEYSQCAGQIQEVTRMLSGFLKKLTADR